MRFTHPAHPGKAVRLAYCLNVHPAEDLAGVVRNRITQDTFIVYEPLMVLAVIYMCLTFLTVWAFSYIEKKVPQKR